MPVDNIAVLVPVDWFLDRIRTPTNVFGNAISAGIVSHFVAGKLSADDSKNKSHDDGHLLEVAVTDNRKSYVRSGSHTPGTGVPLDGSTVDPGGGVGNYRWS